MSIESTGSGMSTWGFVIFFLILFWFFGGNMGFNRNGYGYGVCNDDMNRMHIHDSHMSERDILGMSKTIVEQNAATEKTLAQMAYAQEAQTARILEGQKDLYIRDLERAATNMFITGQTTAITNRLDNLEANATLQRQMDNANVSAQLTAIQNGMLKAPAFVPYGGLPTIGCANYNTCNPCGCNA